jgi:hypothetical protein
VLPSENHNRLAPELLKRLISEGGSKSEPRVVLESIILGTMLYYCPNPRDAGEFMDSMTAAVIDRMKP